MINDFNFRYMRNNPISGTFSSSWKLESTVYVTGYSDKGFSFSLSFQSCMILHQCTVYLDEGLDYSKKLVSFVTKKLKQKFGSDDFVKKMGQVI